MEVNRFGNSKVYKIVCRVTGLIYIGSTTQELKKRLMTHTYHYKMYLAGTYAFTTSYKVLENNNYYIKKIKSYNFENNNELLEKEGYWIRKYLCVNKIIPGRTTKEYHQDNKIAIHLRHKEYHENHKVELNDKHKIYYQKNKIELTIYKKTVCICECGCTYTRSSKGQHLKTEKHAKLMATI